MSRIRPKETLLTTLAVALACSVGSCAPYVYQADFSQRADLARKADLLGPYTGRVIDSGTGKPVAKAIVYASWELVRGVGFVVPGGSNVHVSYTDTDGRYVIPKLSDLPSGASRAVANFRVVVYRRGYVAYRSDRVYPGDERRFDFVQLENRVSLERWNPDLSHVDHLRFIGGGGALRKTSAWEVQAAVAQIEGRRVGSGSAGSTTGSSDGLLDASALLDEDDIEEATGYDGGFRIIRLKDIPRSARYDSRHFQAEGKKSDRFDAAFRVWRLSARVAHRHYKKLMGAYPKAVPKDELGDRSFRSQDKNIGALVWFSKKSGVVVALTCGRNLCKTPKMLLKLAKTLHEHLDQLDNDAPAPGVMPRRVNPFQPVKPRGPVLK